MLFHRAMRNYKGYTFQDLEDQRLGITITMDSYLQEEFKETERQMKKKK